MKKILSILSIGTIFISGVIYSGAGLACNSNNSYPPSPRPTPPTPKPSPKPKPTPKPAPTLKFNLNNLRLDNIKIDASLNANSFAINGINAYTTIENEIINQYQKIISASTLNSNDFALDSTSLNDKSWAIQIYNLNGTSPIQNTKNQTLSIPSGYSVLKNNALKIKITTNDKNVVNSNSNQTSVSATLKGYLNKFIYTNKNLNQGNEVSANTSLSVHENNLDPSNVINFQTGIFGLGFNINSFTTTQALKTAILGIDNAKKVLISKAIVSNLNSQLTNEIKEPNKLGILKSADNNVDSKDAIPFSSSNVSFFRTINNSSIVSFNTPSSLNTLEKVFIRIQIPLNWKYLQNYLGTSNSYVYGYLGTIHQNTKLTLNNLAFYRINVKLSGDKNNFVINGQGAYSKIEQTIITKYKALFPDSQISFSDFVANSLTLSPNKSWAIQLYNINTTTLIGNSSNVNLNFPSNYNVLPDNALKVVITTNDVNVVLNSVSKTNNLKQIALKAYLNKFIYTNKNLNKGNEVGVDTSKSSILNNLLTQNVIDLSSKKFNLGFNKYLIYKSKPSYLSLHLYEQQIQKKALISKAIVSNLNSQLINETSKLATLGLLPIAQNNVSENNSFFFNMECLNLYAVNSNNNIINLKNVNHLGAKWKIFIQIDISNWSYLKNYLTTNNSYVYAYLGNVGENTKKLNLNNESYYINYLSQDLNNNLIKINAHQNYLDIANKIIKKNNAFFWSEPWKQISLNDFVFGTITPTLTKAWTIDLKNGSTSLANQNSVNLGISNTKNLSSNDNCLSVVITTSNPYTTKHVFTNIGLLNQFVFNNKEVNNDLNLSIKNNMPSAIVNKKTVVDFSATSLNFALTNLNFLKSSSASKLLTSLETNYNLTKISNAIIHNIDFAWEKYCTHIFQDLIPRLETLTSSSPFLINNFQGIFKLFERTPSLTHENNFTLINGSKLLNSNKEIFIQIKISTWNYLMNHYYLPLDQTYVYGYLGTTT